MTKNILTTLSIFIIGMSWNLAFGYAFNTIIDISQLFAVFAFAIVTTVFLLILIKEL